MLSNVDLERLIAAKKREILKEKSVLGLSPSPQPRASLDSDKENTPPASPSTIDRHRATVDDQRQESTVDRRRQVQFVDHVDRPRADDAGAEARKENPIPPDLERYIRRYIGLPGMLKAGEYSPNNPLLKADAPRDRDAFLGLGDYERRSKTLRRLRQQEYRQYLDQQAKKKQEERAQAEREARERERREREQEERLRARENEQKRAERERQTYHAERLERNSKRFQDGDYRLSESVERQLGGTTDTGDRQPDGHRRSGTVDAGEWQPGGHRGGGTVDPAEWQPGGYRAGGTVIAGEWQQGGHRVGGTVDAGVQVGRAARLSVGVQTDPAEVYTLKQHHQAERELSPRTGIEPASREDGPAPRYPEPAPRARAGSYDDRKRSRHAGTETDARNIHRTLDEDDRLDQIKTREAGRAGAGGGLGARGGDERPIHPAPWINESRRRSYGDYDERTCTLSTDGNRNKAATKARHVMPSIFDEDAIVRRNNKAEQEVAERRLFYQKELKNQIEEQQRIREERKAREKMLEMAEMRRLEEQLKMLRLAQDRETAGHGLIAGKMRQNAKQFESKRTTLQREIEAEQKSYLRAVTQPAHMLRSIHTSRSEHAFPTSCKLSDLDKIDRKPFSTNIADTSIFSPNYDLDNYLRLNLNPSKESLMSNKMESGLNNVGGSQQGKSDGTASRRYSFGPEYEGEGGDIGEVTVEKALVHDEPKLARFTEKSDANAGKGDFRSDTLNNIQARSAYEPSFLKKDAKKPIETSPLDVIPVLRHSPKVVLSDDDKIIKANESDAMKRLAGKWAVPAVQKNILKTLPSDDGKNVSILTQLGSIRRQLQMEQLKLDKMLSKDSDV